MADLGGIQLLERRELDGVAELRRKRVDRPPQEEPGLGRGGPVVGSRRRVPQGGEGGPGGLVVERDGPAARPTVDGDAESDPGEPGPGVPDPVEVPPEPQDAEVDLLGRVLGVLAVPEDGEGDAVDETGVLENRALDGLVDRPVPLRRFPSPRPGRAQSRPFGQISSLTERKTDRTGEVFTGADTEAGGTASEARTRGLSPPSPPACGPASGRRRRRRRPSRRARRGGARGRRRPCRGT